VKITDILTAELVDELLTVFHDILGDDAAALWLPDERGFELVSCSGATIDLPEIPALLQAGQA
jgi:hypothetical protein